MSCDETQQKQARDKAAKAVGVSGTLANAAKGSLKQRPLQWVVSAAQLGHELRPDPCAVNCHFVTVAMKFGVLIHR